MASVLITWQHYLELWKFVHMYIIFYPTAGTFFFINMFAKGLYKFQYSDETMQADVISKCLMCKKSGLNGVQ